MPYGKPNQHDEDEARRTDPIFSFLTDDHTTLPLSVLLETHGQKTIEELQFECVNGGYASRHSPKSSCTNENEDIVLRSSQHPDKLARSDSLAPRHTKCTQETEESLAALGVTNPSKPVKAPGRPYPSSNLQTPPESRSPPDSGKNWQYQRHYSDYGSSPDDSNPRKRDL